MNHRHKEFASPSILHDLSDSTDGSYANFKNYLSRSGNDDCESSNDDTKNSQGRKRKNILPTSPPTKFKATKLFNRLPSDVPRLRRSRINQFCVDLQRAAEEQLERSPSLEDSASHVITRSRLKNTSAGTPKDSSLRDQSTEKANKQKDKSCEVIERNQFEEEAELEGSEGRANNSDTQDEESVHALNEDEAALLLQHLDQEIIRDSINNEVVVVNCDSTVEEKEETLNHNKIEQSKPYKRKRKTHKLPKESKRSTRLPSVNSDTESISSMTSNTSRYGRVRKTSSNYVQATMFPVSTKKAEEKFKQRASSFINSHRCQSKSLSTFSKSSSVDETKISSPPRNKKSVLEKSVNKITPKKGTNFTTRRATPTSLITSWSSHQNLGEHSSLEAEKSDPTEISSHNKKDILNKKSVKKITPERRGNITTRRATTTSLIVTRSSSKNLSESSSHEAEKSDPTQILSPSSALKKPVHQVTPTKSENSKIRHLTPSNLITSTSLYENLKNNLHEKQLHDDDDVVRINDFDDLFKNPTNSPSCSKNNAGTLKSTPKRPNKSAETGKFGQENEELMIRGNSPECVFKKPMMVLSKRSKNGSIIRNSEISPIVVLENVLLNNSPSRRPVELVKPSLQNSERDSLMMGSSYSNASQTTLQAMDDDNFGIFDSRRRKPDQSKLHAVVNDDVISLKWFAPPPNLDVELSNGTNLYCSLPDFKQYFSTSSAGYLKIEGGGENSMQILRKCYMLYKVEKGEAIVRLPERTRVAQVGSTFFIPQGAEYTIKNTSEEEDLILFFVKMSPPT